MKGPGFPARFLPSATVFVFGLLLFVASEEKLAGAPTVLGPNKCTSCHDHDKQKQWADKDTHTKALDQLEDAKAKKYLAAVGVSDAYDLKGTCVGCHTTVFNREPNAGVSCETCHGPGSAYLEPHQKKGSHAESVRLGLINTRESYAAWAGLCINCHVVTDRRLTAAGHSSGADFELAVKSKKLRESSPGVKHWEPMYDDAKLADAGKAATRARTGGAAPPPKPEVKPQATAPPAATASPARAATATVTKPQPKATPTSAPVPVPPTVEERSPSRPAPTVSPTKPPPKASLTPVPESVRPTVTEKPAERPTATETAVALPTQRSTPPAPRTAAPGQSPGAAPTPGIVIRIEVTPVPTAAPRVQEIPPAAPTALEVAPSATPSPRPTRRPTHRKPRPKPTARPQPPGTPQPAQPAQPAQPPPAPSPTRVRAPATMSVPH